jgi:small ligand-binding sensory domain FIST
LAAQQRCGVQLLGARVSVGVSSGLRLLGEPQRIDCSSGYDLQTLGGRRALDSLTRALPAELRDRASLPLHHLTAVLIDDENRETAAAALATGRYRPIAIVAANAEGSLTLAERLPAGQYLAWASRQPLPAEADMRQTLARLSASAPRPACALMFSCIGRGPFFYGGEDRDLDIVRERFPGLPLLGTYGTGQIAPTANGVQHLNRQLQNAVVTALVTKHPEPAHVQSIA